MFRQMYVVIILISVGFQAVSQDMNRARQIEAAWRGWAQSADVDETSIAIGFGGAFVRSSGLGRAASDPADIASLSKAITAMCLATVLEEQGLSYETRLGDVF